MVLKNILRQIDLFFCFILIPAMLLLLPLDRWWESNSTFVVVLLVWLYAIYWMHRLFTVPLMWGDKRRPIIAVIIILLTLVLTYNVGNYPLDFGHRIMSEMSRPAARIIINATHPLRTSPPSSKMLEQAVWFLYVVVSTFSVVVALLSELNQQMIARQSVEFEKKKAELALYKAQINPHFLFNTLNTLLGLIITKSEQAEEAFIQFSNLMKYMCNSSTKDMVGVQTEIDYIEQYIELQRYRLNEHTDVEFVYSGDTQNFQCMIAPMLLITFVENAIKYGASSHMDSKIKIAINIENGILVLSTTNPILPQQTETIKGTGIGIVNCRKRLELLYPNRYTLLIGENNKNYDVSLTIKLT